MKNNYLTGGEQVHLTLNGVDNPEGWGEIDNTISTNGDIFPDLKENEKLSNSKSYLKIEHPKVARGIDRFVKANLNSSVLKGFEIKNNSYCLNGNSKQMFGVLTLNNPNMVAPNIGAGHGLDFCIGYRNSLDKSLPMDITTGSQVMVCSNLMMTGDVRMIRKHTRGADDLTRDGNNWEREFFMDMDNILKESIFAGMKQHFINNQTRDFWSNIWFDNNEDILKIVGAFTLGNGLGVQDKFKKTHLMNSPQISALRKELGSPSHSEFGRQDVDGDQKFSVWSLYNCFTESLKRTRPNLVMRQFSNLHSWFEDTLVKDLIETTIPVIKTGREEDFIFDIETIENDLKSVV